MPRALVLFLVLSAPLAALDLGALEPVWTIHVPEGKYSAGQSVTFEAEVRLPPGYYQDADSAFLLWEPPAGIPVVTRSSSPPSLRLGKESFTGTFHLTRTIVLPAGTLPGELKLAWKTGWQICQVDGVCLLPAERTLTVNLAVASAGTGLPGLDFWSALAGAFLGGLLLNLMPCVFPVLALKAVGLAAASGLTATQRRRDALFFAAGGFGALTALGLVTATFAALGSRLDWGFSFQQPVFVWVLVLVFWLFTLQLWGVWTWSGSPFSLTVSSKPGWSRSFWGGALLVVAAAPCTAPLLGPALGWAFAQPPGLIPLFFAVTGLGLVLPLLVLQAVPRWSRWLPQPGRWMVTVERTAGFFLAATVVYLLWIFSRQTADDRVWPALILLAGVAAVVALAGRLPSRTVKLVAAVLVLAAAAAALPLASVSAPSRALAPGWRAFSTQELTELAASRPVFVDATAAWCATCQINELAVLDRPDVVTLMDGLGIVRLRADYTKPDAAIAAWLASVNRAGLPVYALYRPGKPPVLFPELLTDGNFTHALAGLLPAP